MLRSLVVGLVGFALATPVAGAAEGKRYAVLVGVTKYDDPAFTPIAGAERDVTELGNVLGAAGYKVTVLTDAAGQKDKDRDPARTNIEKALAAAVKACERDDVLVVAFAGHGARADDRAPGFLCPKDAKPLPNGTDSLLAVEAVCKTLAQGKGRSVLLLDACHQESVGKSGGVDGTALKAPDRVFVLLSCSPGERIVKRSDGTRGQAFFGRVVTGLKGAAADGDDTITFGALTEYVRFEVSKADPKQTPLAVAPTKAPIGPVLAYHPTAPTPAEWADYLRVWSQGGTRPFLVTHAPKRLAAWRAAAEAGSARGMMLLADCHEFGTGVPRDAKRSAEWYAKSAARGNTFAMVGLGICYQRGFGVKKDEKEAAKWFRTGAERGDAGCMEFLGSCYLNGTGVEMDEKEAVKWYRKSVDAGFGQATASLARCYLNGIGVEKDEAEALRWLRKGVDLKSSSAALELGMCYRRGEGAKKDAKEAVKWFRAGSDLGSDMCAVLLGMCYQDGEGVEKNEKEAVKWFRVAAEREYAFAMYLLAQCHFEGTGVEADEKEAVNWLRKAAELDDVLAAFELGVCYLKGIGVAKDRGEAAKWLRRAATAGHSKAKELLKGLSD